MKTIKYLALGSIFFIGLQSSAQKNNQNNADRFDSIDVDGNEIVTIAELIKYHEGKTNKKGEKIDAELMFYGLDRDNNSVITLKEYVKGVNWKAAREHKVIRRRSAISSNILNAPSKAYSTKQVNKFNKIDSDKNKTLSLKEMLDFHEGKINKKGEPFKADLLFYGLDSNSDDELTLDEFVQKPEWKSAKERKVSAKQRIEARKQVMQTPKEIRKIKRQKRKAAKQAVIALESKIAAKIETKIETKKVQTTSNPNKQKQIEKFRRIDSNGDEEISIEEMILFHVDKINKKGDPVESELMFYGLDADDNGKLTQEEFAKKVNWKIAKQKLEAKKG